HDLAQNPEPRGYYLDTLGELRLRKGDNQGALDAFQSALADQALERGTTRALVLDHAAEAHARLGAEAAATRCRSPAAIERGFQDGPGARAGGDGTVVGGPGSVC